MTEVRLTISVGRAGSHLSMVGDGIRPCLHRNASLASAMRRPGTISCRTGFAQALPNLAQPDDRWCSDGVQASGLSVIGMQIKQELIRASQIAAEAHKGQRDKVGNPYFDHCQRVAELVVGEEERTVAFLHDVLEKGSGWTVDRLLQEGFSRPIVEAVVALTRRSGEPEGEFVRRAASDTLAHKVKQADLEDNLVQAEQAGLDTSKYVLGLELLQEL
jgi:molybdopterin-guanine dinucleotide biosynthesis protein